MEAADVFFSVFEALPRQGPGSESCARRALDLCGDLPAVPRIVDLGCGGGRQTLFVLEATGGVAVAVDSHRPLVQRLEREARERGLADRLDARVGAMEDLDLPDGADLVWSEGALYNLGLAAALPLCARLLRPGGALVFTDAIWVSDDPPAPVREAFADYPTMGRADDVLARLAEGPWEVLGHFVLPDAAWWDMYYTPMEERIAALRVEHAEDPAVLGVLDQLAAEPQLRRDHGAHYAYACFVARMA